MGVSAATPAEAGELRGAMVDLLKKRSVQLRPRIEQAFRRVPREAFLPGVGLDRVYSGDAIVTKHDREGRPLSSSSEVGIMIDMAELLDVAPEVAAQAGQNLAAASFHHVAVVARDAWGGTADGITNDRRDVRAGVR